MLWVTRTTLRNDIWKMFDQVLSESIRNKIEYQNLAIPKRRTINDRDYYQNLGKYAQCHTEQFRI